MNYLKHLLAVNKEKLVQVEALVIKYEAFRHLNLKRRTRRNHEEIYIVDNKEITYANQRMTGTVEGIVNYSPPTANALEVGACNCPVV